MCLWSRIRLETAVRRSSHLTYSGRVPPISPRSEWNLGTTYLQVKWFEVQKGNLCVYSNEINLKLPFTWPFQTPRVGESLDIYIYMHMSSIYIYIRSHPDTSRFIYMYIYVYIYLFCMYKWSLQTFSKTNLWVLVRLRTPLDSPTATSSITGLSSKCVGDSNTVFVSLFFTPAPRLLVAFFGARGSIITHTLCAP